jgi:hypothetical protein
LKTEWGVSKSALTGWVRSKLSDGILSWCDEHGSDFADEAALKKAKHSGKAYIKINDSYNVDDVTGLPTPFDLTVDSRWDEGGELYRLYDLTLDRKQIVECRTSENVEKHDQAEDESAEEKPEAEKEFSFDEWCP